MMTDTTLGMSNVLLRQAAAVDARSEHSFQAETIIHAPSTPREGLRIPRIAIQAFCATSDVAAAVDKAAQDRLMSRARVSSHMGGIAAAIEQYRQSRTSNLLVIESCATGDTFLADLDRLALACDPGTRVLAIGYTNDIAFYRELIKRGVSDYLLAPVHPVDLIASISRIFEEQSSGKLGRSYAFIGAKGGVGSSTMAHNVAWTIARKLSSDVVLADMDLPFGTAALDFNLDAEQGIADAIQDTGRLDEVLLDRLLQKYDEYLSVLAAPTHLERSYDLSANAMEPLLEVAQASVPFMVLDIPHQWTSWSRNVLVAADEIIITASPDLANLRNAKNMIDVLKRARPHDPPPKLVLNQVGMPKRPEITPKDFAKALQIEPLACLPSDAGQFGNAANKGKMVAETSGRGLAAKAFADVADALAGHHGSKRRKVGLLGLRSLIGKMRTS
jgi:pilus assembly protein CpaE